ncbi:MAG: class B sortase, partial [Lachnospiraceae bacterium]|nr:class B sortase [Lachnospiraceae bacterium]
FAAKKSYEQLASDSVFEDVTAAPDKETQEGLSGQVSAWDGAGAVLAVDFERLLSENPDTVAWLHVPAADVSYPVVYHAENNDYYLHRAFDGAESAAGSIYLEHTNTSDFSDSNSFLYGHNMRDGSMFGQLRKRVLLDSAYTQEPYIYLYLPDNTVRRYLIFSCYDTTRDSDTYFTFSDDEAYDWYVNFAKAMSLHADDDAHNADDTSAAIAFATRNPILTLSTCEGASGTPNRFVVHGVLVGELNPGRGN